MPRKAEAVAASSTPISPHATISGVIVAFNEESNIRYSLGSLLPWCDEVVVVDQESHDRTAEIARELGARVVSHPNTGFVEAAREFSINQTTGEWLLVLDADEVIPASLARRLREVADGRDRIDVVRIPRVNIVLGRWARVGRRNWPNRHLRFFRRGSLIVSDRIHVGLSVSEGARRLDLPADRRLAIWHFSYESVDDMMEKFNRYTSVQARQALGDGGPAAGSRQFLMGPLRSLWTDYVRRRGYRDGTAGLIVAIARSFYEFLLATKTWDEARLGERMAARDALRDRLIAGYGIRPEATDERA